LLALHPSNYRFVFRPGNHAGEEAPAAIKYLNFIANLLSQYTACMARFVIRQAGKTVFYLAIKKLHHIC
jgi:hypothetical protein